MNTQVLSNGSKWAGQKPDSIQKLIEVLKTEVIEERFFTTYRSNPYSVAKAKYENFCPIMEENGEFTFFGNFEARSHVFRIITTEPELIEKLSRAIKENEGWKKYYQKNLLK